MNVSHEVQRILSTSRTEGKKLFLPGSLNRQMYLQTNTVLEAAGGAWNRKERAHVFPSDAQAAIADILLTGKVVIAKDEFGYFPSPRAVVERAMDLAEISKRHYVLEPSAGRGALAKAAAATGARVDCVEILADS